LDAPRIDLPGGFALGGEATGFDVVVPELTLAVEDLMASWPRRSTAALTEAATAVEAEPPADPEPRRRLDLDFLDRIDGRLDVDLTVDVTLPVLGSRRKTHHFRVPIAKGTFNYKDLEGDLAKLEDAFI